VKDWEGMVHPSDLWLLRIWCAVKEYDGWTYNCAESVHQLVIHPYNAKQPLLQHLHDGIPPLDGQTLPDSRLEIEIFSWSEARNLPTWGCKSMTEGLTIMLRVFINLLYTYTMPNNHYCSNYMMPYPHLLAKHCLRVGRNWDLRQETCLHVAVKVWWMDLQSCWECSSTCYIHRQCQTTTIVAPACYYTPTWWPNLPESLQIIHLQNIGELVRSPICRPNFFCSRYWYSKVYSHT